FQLRFLITHRRFEIKRETNWILVGAQEPINSFERNRLKMITVERRRRIMSGVHILTAGLVSAMQTRAGMRWIFSWNIIVRVDVMMVEIDRELEIIRHSVFELLPKIDDTIATTLFFPPSGNPLFKFAMPFRRKIGSISPRKDRLVPVRGGNSK